MKKTTISVIVIILCLIIISTVPVLCSRQKRVAYEVIDAENITTYKIGDVFILNKNWQKDPFKREKQKAETAKILDIKDGYIQYEISYPDINRPSFITSCSIDSFIRLYQKK